MWQLSACNLYKQLSVEKQLKLCVKVMLCWTEWCVLWLWLRCLSLKSEAFRAIGEHCHLLQQLHLDCCFALADDDIHKVQQSVWVAGETKEHGNRRSRHSSTLLLATRGHCLHALCLINHSCYLTKVWQKTGQCSGAQWITAVPFLFLSSLVKPWVTIVRLILPHMVYVPPGLSTSD